MTTIILNEQTAQTPLGEFLLSATDPEIHVQDESGRFVATILLQDGAADATSDEALAEAEANIEEIRRRMQTSTEHDITTKELLARCRALTGE